MDALRGTAGSELIDLELPVCQPIQSKVRPPADVLAMAIVVQANLVHFKVADSRRRGIDSCDHEVRVEAPGSVMRFREALVAATVVKSLSDDELRMQLHRAWGEYCLMRWALGLGSDRSPAQLGTISADVEPRCETELAIKEAEIHAELWRIRHEVRVRSEAGYTASAEFAGAQSLAVRIPATVGGKPIARCLLDELVASGCEHVGMLSCIRWISDREKVWDDPSLAHVSALPFDAE